MKAADLWGFIHYIVFTVMYNLKWNASQWTSLMTLKINLTEGELRIDFKQNVLLVWGHRNLFWVSIKGFIRWNFTRKNSYRLKQKKILLKIITFLSHSDKMTLRCSCLFALTWIFTPTTDTWEHVNRWDSHLRRSAFHSNKTGKSLSDFKAFWGFYVLELQCVTDTTLPPPLREASCTVWTWAEAWISRRKLLLQLLYGCAGW